jgi:hypothetical protein
MTELRSIEPYDQDGPPEQKLMVSSLVYLDQMDDPVEVQRGMMIMGQDKQEAGMVAAVVLDCHSQKGTHLLLGHLPPTSDYRLIPLNLIDRIDGETVWLRASFEEIEKLPMHQPD